MEWGLDPVYIGENWTDELLDLMVQKLAARKSREQMGQASNSNRSVVRAADESFFKKIGAKVVKHGNERR